MTQDPIATRRIRLTVVLLIAAFPPLFLAVLASLRLGGLSFGAVVAAMLASVVYTAADAVRDGITPSQAWFLTRTTRNLAYAAAFLVVGIVAFGIGTR